MLSGIVAYGAYVPLGRLPRRSIQNVTGEPAAPGEKAVAGYDEDSLSMAVEAGWDCLAPLGQVSPGVVYFATTTPPYLEKQGAATLAGALDLPGAVRTADITGSLRCGSNALLAALDAVQGGVETALVAVGDCRLGAPQGAWEQVSGDGAAAFMLGGQNVLAEYLGGVSLAEDILSQWRTANDQFVRTWEERFFISKGYNRLVKKAVSSLLGRHALQPADVHRLVLYGPNPRYQMALARQLGFELDQVQDSLFATAGMAGCAGPLLMLVGALEEARPGQLILLVTFGEGCDALLFRVTEAIERFRPRRGLRGHLASRREINYHTYLKWRQIIPQEPPRRPDPGRPSAPGMWRGGKQKLAFYGSRCQECGTPQFPPQRVCVHCQAVDKMVPYRFLDRPASIVTYTVDYLTFSQDPPAVFAVLDFEGGGRMICELTDCDPQKLSIGMQVEMTFRSYYRADGIVNYYWKARPRRQEVQQNGRQGD